MNRHGLKETAVDGLRLATAEQTGQRHYQTVPVVHSPPYRSGFRTRISPSIQASTSRLISAALRPAVGIAGPTETVIMPDFLMKACRGQYSPALWAIGIIGASVALAS